METNANSNKTRLNQAKNTWVLQQIRINDWNNKQSNLEWKNSKIAKNENENYRTFYKLNCKRVYYRITCKVSDYKYSQRATDTAKYRKPGFQIDRYFYYGMI